MGYLDMGNWKAPIISHDDLIVGEEVVFAYNGGRPEIGTVERINRTTIRLSRRKPLAKTALVIGLCNPR